jgi:hypothetical protein
MVARVTILTICYGILAAGAAWAVTPNWRAALWGGIVGAAAYLKGKLEEQPGQNAKEA